MRPSYPPPPECHRPPVSRTTIDGVTRCSRCQTELTEDDFVGFTARPVSKQGIPSQWNSVPPRRPNNSFERQTRKDDRGLPYLDSSGKPLKMKEKFDPAKYGKSRINID